MIKISVIVPVYNMEKYVKECLDSILSQTLKEIEIICVNDGSTDSSYTILLEYQQKHQNIIVLHQENQGAAVAQNKGMESARGKYICFMGPDDYYAQDAALEQLFVNAEENHVSVCGGDFVSIWPDGRKKKPKKWFDRNQLVTFKEYGNYYCYTSYIFKLEMLKRYNITFPPYRRYQDPPFMMTVMLHAQEFYAINELIYAYRVGHKKEQMSLPRVLDVLNGIRDCFKMAKEYNLTKAYEEQLNHKLTDYLSIIYPYARQDKKEIWTLIDEINQINMEWMGEYCGIFLDKTSLEAHIEKLREEQKKLIETCQKATDVVIYGAGEAGQFFLHHYAKDCKHIVGFAVSKKNKEEFFEGYTIKEINDYDRELLVVVAVGKQYAQEILQNLQALQFNNVCYVEYANLRVLEELV